MMFNNKKSSKGLLALTLMTLSYSQVSAVSAEETEQMQELEVVGVTPTHGVGLSKSKIPANVLSVSEFDLENAMSTDLTDYMNRNLGSVNINIAQNNPLQPDVQYRGFTASPLLGLPQGLSIYQNGVRVNEPLGDAVNWDLLPQAAIHSMNLISGANPVFGLNTLGGAISIQMKNGFNYDGHELELLGGAFSRKVLSLESGGNDGTFGYYINMHDFSEDGWRDLSESDATNIYASFSFRNTSSTLDLSLQHGDSDLFGNGASPAELLATDRDAVFTAPDITNNDMNALTLEGTHWLKDSVQLSGNLFWRKIQTDSFNGDGSEFEVCDDGSVIEEDNFNDVNGDDECQSGTDIIDPAEIVLTVTPGDEFDAINNISSRTQESYGANLQSSFLGDLFDRENQLIVGASFRQGLSRFRSRTELAEFDARRSTDPSVVGPEVTDEANNVKTRTRSSSLYATDTLSVTDAVAVTLAVRYDNTRVKLGDLTGDNPRLNGVNDYERFNPAAGITWQVNESVNAYGNYSESSRAPTAIELACTDESLEEDEEGCRLPNAFLADPPLEQVVAKGFDAGFRGQVKGVNYHLGAFHTTNENDIIFISRGGASGNVGVFDNVGDTRRVGMESSFSGSVGKIDWFANYSFVDATFQDNFVVTSPNHPVWDADPTNARLVDLDGDNTLDSDTDGIQVRGGDRIPGIPQHTLKIGGDYWFSDSLSVGVDMVYNSDQYFRGDEANLDGTVDGFVVFNLRARYAVNEHVSFFGRVDNLFDNDYESFGLYGEADEVDGFEAFTNPRFLGAGAPVGIWLGMKVAL